MLRPLVILLVCVCGLSQGAKYCCLPPVWESLNFFRTGGLVNGTLVSTSGEEMVSVDTTKNFVNSMASITSSGVTTSVRTIQDWGRGKQYVVLGQKCSVSSLQGPYPNKCIPDDAREVAPDIEFGIDTHQMSVHVFQVTRGNMTAFVDVVKPDCIPMSVSAFGSDSKGTGMSVKLYTNVTLGIKDPSVFVIPSFCAHTTPKPLHPIRGGEMHDIF